MKNIGKLILVTAIMMIFAFQSNAQNAASADQTASKANTGNFVDKDSDGVCDNFNTKSGKGNGANFVDKNNDGVCDNRANVKQKSGKNCRNGQGNQYRNGQGRRCGNNCRR